MNDEAQIFESHRPALMALAYRMLGDVGRAEDIVQDAWLRWQERGVDVDAPRAFLLKIVTRLCLNELESARARREESRSDRLPEPLDSKEGGIGQVNVFDQVSMAFVVALQRLTHAERAVLLLHDVFDFDHREIAALLHKSEPACRQLLKRARENVAVARRVLTASPEEHGRLLRAFLQAVSAGKVDDVVKLLADDAVMIADGGPTGVRFAGVRNLPRPLYGAKKIAAFLTAVGRRHTGGLQRYERELNGQPAIVTVLEGRAISALLLSVADGKIQHIFVQADPARLGHLGPLN